MSNACLKRLLMREIGPKYDYNSYRGLVLANEMKVLLISDPRAATSACALNIKIGGFSDPDELPGLAHLCQRTLVLGTAECPSYQTFQEFLIDHGGSYKGITTANDTSYYFQVDGSNFFKEALRQYVYFFVNPLFKEEWIEMEINLLHWEYTSFTLNDLYNRKQFIKSTANSNHPHSRFIFGNKKTLKIIPEQRGVNIRNQLLDFYEKYYSANIMTLCLFSDESLDEMEKMAISMFSIVKNKQVHIPLWYDNPFKDNSCNKWCISPNTNVKILNIVFPLPEVPGDYWYMALEFIILLLQHQGEGSIYAVLSQKNWIKNIIVYHEANTGSNDFLTIECVLTKTGVSNINEITGYFFQYLNMLKLENNRTTSSEQILPLLYKIFTDEFIGEKCVMIPFNPEYTAKIAKLLCTYSLKKIPIIIGRDIIKDITWEHSQYIMNWILNNYIIPQNIRIYIFVRGYKDQGNTFSPDWCGEVMNEKEKIPTEMITAWTNILNTTFPLPSLNTFKDIKQDVDRRYSTDYFI